MAKSSLPQICSITDCSKTTASKLGWCSMHYARWKRHGDPLVRGSCKLTEADFWARVDKSPGLGPNGDCWEWTGRCGHTGYGRIMVNYRDWLAHRLAWLYVKGEEAKMHLLHSCDNTRCVNVAHLREGTIKENAQDMVERGRSARGERHPRVTLTEATVLQIKKWFKEGVSMAEVARRVNSPYPTITSIKSGRNWKWLKLSDEVI